MRRTSSSGGRSTYCIISYHITLRYIIKYGMLCYAIVYYVILYCIRLAPASAPCARPPRPPGGAKYCTPEIDTSEIIVDFQWHFPTYCHSSVVLSKGLSLVQWIFTGIVKWTFSDILQGNFTFLISGV